MASPEPEGRSEAVPQLSFSLLEQEAHQACHGAGDQKRGGVRFKKRKSIYGYGRRKAAKDGPWTEERVKRVLANPFYCGFTVDPVLTSDRAVDEGQYIQTARQIIQEVGAGAFLQSFLEKLKDPSSPLPPGTSVTEDRFVSSIKVHPHFAMEHPSLVTEEEFIQAGIVGIGESGVEEYLRHLLENLKGNWV
jgi:hypothetical protein